MAVEVGVEAGQWQAGLLARRLALAGQAGEEQAGALVGEPRTNWAWSWLWTIWSWL